MYLIKSYSISYIKNHITLYQKQKKLLYGYYVSISNKRLQTFKKRRDCVCCGLKGNRFVLCYPYKPNRYKGAARPDVSKFGPPHLNLFANWNKEFDKDLNYNINNMVLMTKDHIVPASLGGKDSKDNLQTMCTICNQIKDNNDVTLEQLFSARKFYNSVAGSKKAFKETKKYLESLMRK